MWILITFFLISGFLLGWLLFGYYIWLFILSLLKKEENFVLESFKEYPSVALIVPTYNEEKFILQKIENLRKIDYPKENLKIIFVDGGSHDKTLELIKSNSTENMQIVFSPYSGKIAQLNYVLPSISEEFIFISDADGIISENAIKEMLKEFMRNKNVRVVGAYTYTESSYEVESYWWSIQNKIRLLERQAFTSSVIVSICYGFYKDFFRGFPDDVIADDVYISYLCNMMGFKTSYIDSCYAKELRCPSDIRSFLSHKFRKANAFLRESLRFLYLVSEMPPLWRISFLTKICQLFFLPWTVLLFLALGLSLISIGKWDIFLVVFISLLFLLILTSKLFSLIGQKTMKFSFWVKCKTFFLSNFLLFINGFGYLFYRQTSSYKKVKK